MKKFENLGKNLSKDEQSNVMGGVADPGGNGNYGSCTCTQHAGSWTYTSCPTFFGLLQDIASYCRGGASCNVQTCGL